MQKWNIPSVIKIYEALGAIGDNRIEINDWIGKIYSSSKSKFYTVKYELKTNSIMCNDNASYYLGDLWYPAIAYLMQIWELDLFQEYAQALKDVHWKDINQLYKNDYEKTKIYANNVLKEKWVNVYEFEIYVQKVLKQIKVKNLNLLGKKELPPEGY